MFALISLALPGFINSFVANFLAATAKDSSQVFVSEKLLEQSAADVLTLKVLVFSNKCRTKPNLKNLTFRNHFASNICDSGTIAPTSKMGKKLPETPLTNQRHVKQSFY